MSSLFVQSIQGRIRVMNSLWERILHDLSLEQINHQERPGVLPIAFYLSHVIRGQDTAISTHFLREEPLWNQDDWASRIGVTVDRYGRGEELTAMERQRFTDLNAWKSYQAIVLARTMGVVETLTASTLAEVVMPSLPEEMALSYCGQLIGLGNPMHKLEVLECYVYQHGLRHLGEVEHARSFFGLSGMTG